MDQERRSPATTPEWSLDPAGAVLVEQILEAGESTSEHPDLKRYFRADKPWELEVTSRKGGRAMFPPDPEGLMIVSGRATLPGDIGVQLALVGDKVHSARMFTQGVAVEGQQVYGQVIDSLRLAFDHFSS